MKKIRIVLDEKEIGLINTSFEDIVRNPMLKSSPLAKAVRELKDRIYNKFNERYEDYFNFETYHIAKYINDIYEDETYRKELNNAGVDNYDKFSDYITSTGIHYETSHYLDGDVGIDDEILDIDELDKLIKKLCSK